MCFKKYRVWKVQKGGTRPQLAFGSILTRLQLTSGSCWKLHGSLELQIFCKSLLIGTIFFEKIVRNVCFSYQNYLLGLEYAFWVAESEFNNGFSKFESAYLIENLSHYKWGNSLNLTKMWIIRFLGSLNPNIIIELINSILELLIEKNVFRRFEIEIYSI